MPVQMPARDEAVLKRRSEIVRALRAIVPDEGVISAEREMRPYESDGLTAYRQLPMVVVLPRTVDQVSRVLRYCHSNGDQGGSPRGRHLAVRRGACRWATAYCSGWRGSTASARSISPTGSPWWSRA